MQLQSSTGDSVAMRTARTASIAMPSLGIAALLGRQAKVFELQIRKDFGPKQPQVHQPGARDPVPAPLADSLAAHLAQASGFYRPPQGVDDHAVGVHWWFHAISVSQLTRALQAGLQPLRQYPFVRREPTTEAQRVTWAKTHSGRTWADLASAIGCSHAALSLWGSGQTALANAKVHLVVDFARETDVNVQWLLTGDGPAISAYPAAEHRIVQQARLIAEERPALAEIGYELLQSLGKAPGDGT